MPDRPQARRSEAHGRAGKYRGGLGLRRDYRPIGHQTTFSGQGERFVNRPWGIFGGHPGGTSHFAILHDDSRVDRLANKPSTLKAGPEAQISVVTAGAGGFGEPAERSAEDLGTDAASGKFGTDFLNDHYPQFDEEPK